jgi:probable HAF family extracellular repeat protein
MAMGRRLSVPSLAIGIALVGACGGGSEPSIVAGKSRVEPASIASTSAIAPYTTRVLSLGGSIGFGRFNKPGQVAGASTLAGDARWHAFFFDGATLVDLGAGAGRDSFAVALNDPGRVVGYETIQQAEAQAFSWTPSGGKVFLPNFPGTIDARPTGLNNAGEVVGIDTLGPLARRSFHWTGSTLVDLGTLGGQSTDAFAINGSGTAIGVSRLAGDATYHAFAWTLSGGMVDLGSVSGPNSFAQFINAAGQVVGMSLATNAFPTAFVWTRAGGMVPLTTTYSTPLQLTESGRVVGYALTPDLANHRAFSWTAAGGLVDLGTLPDRTNSEAVASNASGLVVGTANTGNLTDTQRAVVWLPPRGIVDLGTLGGPASTARAVNDAGEVVGAAVTAQGEAHAFVWTERSGLVDLNDVTADKPPGTVLKETYSIHASGAILAQSNKGLVLLRPSTTGFVTGGGWIDSRAGADPAQPGVAGRASFSLEARIPDGATVPEGAVQFELHAAGLSFSSDACEWLRIFGGEARLGGTGALNGVGGYHYVLTAVDGAQSGAEKRDDRFALRISHDTATGEVVDYDSGPVPIGGGNVVIHLRP